jgi:hypothetical protein
MKDYANQFKKDDFTPIQYIGGIILIIIIGLVISLAG